MSNNKKKSAAPNSAVLSDLLSAIADLVRTYLVVSEAQCIVIALWVVHTYCIEAFDRTPYLHISSAEKRSGKTLLLEILALLAYKPWFTSNASTAAVARKIAFATPTALIDEADTFLLGASERAELLRGILNAGYAKNGTYSRVSSAGDVVDIQVFCPKAIAGLQSLPDTIADRSIPIKLKRATAEERRCRFDRREAERVANDLRKQVEAYSEKFIRAFTRPQRIDQLNDRQNDIVEPLMAIANFAAGEWPEKARAALLKLFAPEAEEYQNVGTQLLGDIRDIFNEAGVEKMETKELIRRLCDREESPWSDYSHGRALTAHILGRTLKPYEVQSSVWWDHGRSVRGYQRCDFEDAWTRYLPQRREAAEGHVAVGGHDGRDVHPRDDSRAEPAEPVFYGDGHGGASTSPLAINSALVKPVFPSVHPPDCFCPACRGEECR
jgi:hypothetical protein